MNIADKLAEAARRRSGRAAVIARDRAATFGELEKECGRLAAGLERAGVRPGTRAALMVPPGFDFAALAFALFRVGAVPVLIDPGIGWKNLGRCLAEAGPEAFIGGPLAHAARVVGGWARSSLRLKLAVDGLRGSGEASAYGARAEDTAAVLFTSGSTGAPKGAVYSHGNFTAQLDLLSGHFGIAGGEVSVATFPLFGLFDLALGSTVVFPEMDFTRPGRVRPDNILGPIARHGARQLFGSPALLDRVGRHGAAAGVRIAGLKRVISAGAPVDPKILRRFQALLDADALIHTPYGATEALPVSCIESREILEDTSRLTARGRGVCVGRPMPGVDVRILPVSEAPIPEWSERLALPAGEIGEIAVKGGVVTRSYHGRPEADALAKIKDGASVWHRMGDLGSFDAQGRLWFHGRKSERVATEAGTLHTASCEGVFNSLPRVRRAALVGVGPDGAKTPVVCVEAESGARSLRSLRAELEAAAGASEVTRGLREFLFHPGFPVDIRHNAKINRPLLASWASRVLR